MPINFEIGDELTRKFIYSNKRFWTFILICIGLIILSIGFQISYVFRLDYFQREKLALITQTIFQAYRTQYIEPTIKYLRRLVILKTSGEFEKVILDLQERNEIYGYAMYDIRGVVMRTPRFGAYKECYSLRSQQDTNDFCISEKKLIYKFKIEHLDRLWVIFFPVLTEDIEEIQKNFNVKIAILGDEKVFFNDAESAELVKRNAYVTKDYQVNFLDFNFARALIEEKSYYRVVVHLSKGRYYFVVYQSYTSFRVEIINIIIFHLVFSTILLILTYLFHVNYKFLSYAYRSLIDSMVDGLWFKDLSGRYQIVNKTWAQNIYGKHPILLVGKTDRDLDQENTFLASFEDSDRQILSNQILHRKYEHGFFADGSPVILDTIKTPCYDESGKFTGIICCARDISEQRYLEEAVATLSADLFSEQWILKTIFNIIPIYLYIKDRNHVFIRISRSIAKLYDLAPEYIIGKTDRHFLSVKQADLLWEIEESIIRGKLDFYKGTEVVQTATETITNLITKVPIKDKNGIIQGVLGIGTEITEMKQSCDKLEEAVQMMTAFFSDLSERKKTETVSMPLPE